MSDIGRRLPNLRVARPAGIEPATPSLEGSCSIRLSYGRYFLTREKRSDGEVSGNGASDIPFGRGKHTPEAVLLRND